jgi:hypothetical protein
MPYLAPDFEHDVFMSYAHGRRVGSDRAPLREWSEQFILLLQDEIYSLQPEIGTLDVWYDRRVDPTAALTDEIKTKVERSGVLLIIMSEWYLRSKWCTEELDWFKAQFLGRRRSPGRVFVVRVQATNTDDWPAFLKDDRGQSDIGYQFHSEAAEQTTDPYGWPDPRDLRFRTEEFNKVFSTLRSTLIKRLKVIKASGKPASQPSSPSQVSAAPPRLYLHAPPGPEEARVTVENELRAEGYTIVRPVARASAPIAWRAERNERVEAVQACDALTLLRATDDPAFDLEFSAVGVDTLSRINRTRGDHPFPCAILDRSGAPFEDADYARRSGIALFDLCNPHWRSEFKTWLDAARA